MVIGYITDLASWIYTQVIIKESAIDPERGVDSGPGIVSTTIKARGMCLDENFQLADHFIFPMDVWP